MQKLICGLCKKEFNNSIGLRAHIWQSHKILIKEYYDKFLKKPIEGICRVCGKETSFCGLKYGYRNYHSNCSLKSLEVRNKQLETRKQKSKKIEKFFYYCEICGKGLKNKSKSLGQHLRNNHKEISSKEYYDKFFKKENENKCKLSWCANSTKFNGFKYGYLKYCCNSHGQLGIEAREKIYKSRVKNGEWIQKELKSSYERYCEEIENLTKLNYKRFKNIINPLNLKIGRKEFTIDHKLSRKDGFQNNISPEVVSHPYNLEILVFSDNYKKSGKSSITKEQLFKQIESEEKGLQ